MPEKLNDLNRLCIHSITNKPWNLDECLEKYSKVGIKGITIWREKLKDRDIKQISRQITFPKVYLDIWRSLPWGFDNYRFQGEIEYRPDFPVRFRPSVYPNQTRCKRDVENSISQA